MANLNPQFHEPLNLEAFTFRHEKFSELIPEDSIVLDVGAHVGGFSIVFGSCVPKGKVLAFEPNPLTFKTLEKNTKDNPDYNIIPYNYAATQESKPYTFYYSDPERYGNGMNGGNFNDIKNGSQIKQFHTTPVEVKGVNLYDFLLENYKDELHKIKFIKTDTEGYDKEVLKTLAPLINRNKPVLMVESFMASTKEEIADYFETIKSFGYEIYDIAPLDNKTDCTGPLNGEEFEYYTYNIMENGNFLCCYKDDLNKFNLPTTIPGKTAVVVFGRNDGYKEQERFIIHINTMLETFDEVIYIDWNSPTHSFLYDVMDRIHHTGRLKHFIIPPEYAHLMTMGDEKAQACTTVLIQNIGLRRTDAEWVVMSTTDVIPPYKEVLNEFISKANRNTFYTLSRRDIEYDDVITNLDRLDDYRKELDQTTEPRYFPTRVTPNDVWSIFNCCGDFQLAHKNVWFKIRGYEEPMMYSCYPDTNIQKKAILYGFKLEPVYDIPLYHMSHKGMGNDGSSPSKQYYNNPWEWIENFNRYEHPLNKHIGGTYMVSRNADTWGFSNVEIEYETI